jgi:hypothetical protein
MSIIQELKDENANTIAKQRSVAFNYLFNYAKDDVMVGKFYLFEYDPKTKAQLARWDKYPLVLVTNIYEDGFMGANFHYTTQKQRMLLAKKFLNNNVRIPIKLLHRYIISRADNIFFEVPEKELVEFAALPIEEFRDGNNRFVSAKKVQLSRSK